MDSTKENLIEVNPEQLKIIVEALNYFYTWNVRKANRAYKHVPRPLKVSQELAAIQITLQFMMLVQNIRTNKLNEALAAGIGLTKEETSDNTREEELDGSEGGTATVP
jgi:hypothetical protein